MPRRAGSVALALLVGACSWSRFDEVSEPAPVEVLERPSALKAGFGNVVAVAAQGERVRALVGGVPLASPAAHFELGFDERPGIQAVSAVVCESRGPRACFLATQPAGLRKFLLRGEEQERCFAVGLGRDDSTLGLQVRCDAVSVTQPVPEVVEAALTEVFEGAAEPPELFAASDREEEPTLLAATPRAKSAWFYPPLESVPQELVPPRAPGEQYGRAVAVVGISGGRIFAVGDPGKSEVWLYRWLGEEPEVLGCLGGAAGLGRSLAAGRIDEDDEEELVVADNGDVWILRGAALAAASPAPDEPCGVDWLPEGAELDRLTCDDVDGSHVCEGSEFGAALIVADLDGDGSGEIIVGAPGMSAAGKRRTGAMLVYDWTQEGGAAFADLRLLSSSTEGSRFGAALAVAPQRGRDVILAGAPGANKAALIYCSDLYTGESARCR